MSDASATDASAVTDPRLAPARWSPLDGSPRARRKLALMIPVNVILTVWYFQWLLQPRRVGNPVLYGVLVAAEIFNVIQAAGFWWTALRAPSSSPPAPPPRFGGHVDVLIPTYNETIDVVEPTVAAAAALRGAQVHVVVCDDGDRDEMAALAARHGATYLRRPAHDGAKAGNLNHALARTTSPVVVVLDCDHVADPSFLEATLGHLEPPDVAFVQTPQYYANTESSPLTAASWSQQALFFGIIARGKDAMGAMICCGTNVVFRREALAAVGGFPEDTVTEDFELSIRLREGGWRSAYVPQVLASGLGPEDMASYVSQQHRWARGCLAAIASSLRAKLPLKTRAQYLLSSMFFLTGWTYLVYMLLPVANIVDLGGAQPLAQATSDQFIFHFAPYFCASLLTVAVAGAGSYSFAAFSLMEASFWIHIHASVLAVLRRKSGFVVTPKKGASGRQPRAVLPALVALTVLTGAAADGLAHSHSPAMLNNVAFASLHISVLLVGVWPAVFGRGPRTAPPVARAPAAVDPPAALGQPAAEIAVGAA